MSILMSTWREHDHVLLILAAGIWLVGSFSLFLLLQRSLEFGPTRRRQWGAISAITGGIGVWATHFVAMLGHHDGMPMHYDMALTCLSIAEVVTLFWVALLMVQRRPEPKTAFAAGTIAATGVAGMHFTGMAAMAGIDLHYDHGAVAFYSVLSAVLFVGAFLAFAALRGWRQVAGAALLAILSVVVLHFGAMAATTMTMAPEAMPRGDMDRTWLVTAIAVATALLLVVTGLAMFLDRYLTDLRGLAAATLEGLAIVRGRQIVEVNDRFAAIVGVDARALIGSSPEEWLMAADGLPVLAVRTGAVEAASSAPASDHRIFEAQTHGIEYRGRDCIVLALRDLTEERAAQRQIEHMARHDALTDLPNRTLLDERIAHGLALAQREQQSLALLALDLDRFKAVNDIFGHAAGDQVLCRVASILRGAVRASDTVARIGGDEFMILQIGAPQPEGAEALSRRILDAFADEMDMARDPTAVGVSIGVAVFPSDAADAESLRHGADIALYRAKQSGRGVACFFDQDMDKAVRERRALEHDLRHAVVRRQMHVVYQPLVTTADHRITGYEALLRWTHPERGEIPPEKFIPIAEDTGSIVQLGEWVLREACTTATAWPETLSLAINVSPVQLQLAGFPETVAQVLAETGLAPARLEIEITESVLIKDRAGALELLSRLKALGVRIVMDDFGTGYSSLSNLQSFPFDKIKIDRSFVSAMEDDNAARSIIRAIVGIGRSLSLPVVAEGVETASQHRMVLEEGCAQAQGYLFGYPAPMMRAKSIAAAA